MVTIRNRQLVVHYSTLSQARCLHSAYMTGMTPNVAQPKHQQWDNRRMFYCDKGEGVTVARSALLPS